MAVTHPRKIRSFVRRPGRTTTGQRRALESLLPRFGLAVDDEMLRLDEVFGRSAPRVLEIGFGDGEALFTSAANNPEIDHLGIEIHEPGVGHLLMLVQRAGITNVRIAVRDAVDVIARQLPDASFDTVRIFFPDPWPKKRHHKRRLVQADFVAALARVIKPAGLLHIATDWPHYAEHISDVLSDSADFEPLAPGEAARYPMSARAPTKFERRGRRLGHEVVDLYYRRRD
jgi:tRNA (guanine-N7-)-methyltransferase